MQKALVVDDSRAIRRILTRTLNGLGYEVAEAANGREALEVIHGQADWSLVLVDWNMPEMNGIDFIRAVRSEARYSAVPLIMVTTETHADQMTMALEAGANDYIMKPFSPEMIAEKLHLLESFASH